MNKIIFFVLFGLVFGQTNGNCCCLSNEEKQQLNAARKSIEKTFRDTVRLNIEALDFASASHRAISEAEKIKTRHPEAPGMKTWLGRLLQGVRKVQGISKKINEEKEKIGHIRKEMDKCLDRKDVLMCRELADEAKGSFEIVKQYRQDVGTAYRNAYIQSDLGIGELAEKVKETMKEYLSRPGPSSRPTFKDQFISD